MQSGVDEYYVLGEGIHKQTADKGSDRKVLSIRIVETSVDTEA
jgi:hypothetical protein